MHCKGISRLGGWRVALAGLAVVAACGAVVSPGGAAMAGPAPQRGLSTGDSGIRAAGGAPEQTLAGHRRHHPFRFLVRIFGTSADAPVCDSVVAGSTGTIIPVDRLGSVDLCFDGFDRRQRPTVLLRSPSGAVATFPAEGSGSYGWGWYAFAGLTDTPIAQLGVYQFWIRGSVISARSAASRPAVASGRLVVRPADRPTVNWTGDPAPGRQLVLMASGYRPGTVVDIAAFAEVRPGGAAKPPDEDHAVYNAVADLPRLATNERGEGLVRWRIPAEAAGAYGFWIDPSPAQDHCDRTLCLLFRVDR